MIPSQWQQPLAVLTLALLAGLLINVFEIDSFLPSNMEAVVRKGRAPVVNSLNCRDVDIAFAYPSWDSTAAVSLQTLVADYNWGWQMNNVQKSLIVGSPNIYSGVLYSNTLTNIPADGTAVGTISFTFASTGVLKVDITSTSSDFLFGELALFIGDTNIATTNPRAFTCLDATVPCINAYPSGVAAASVSYTIPSTISTIRIVAVVKRHRSSCDAWNTFYSTYTLYSTASVANLVTETVLVAQTYQIVESSTATSGTVYMVESSTATTVSYVPVTTTIGTPTVISVPVTFTSVYTEVIPSIVVTTDVFTETVVQTDYSTEQLTITTESFVTVPATETLTTTQVFTATSLATFTSIFYSTRIQTTGVVSVVSVDVSTYVDDTTTLPAVTSTYYQTSTAVTTQVIPSATSKTYSSTIIYPKTTTKPYVVVVPTVYTNVYTVVDQQVSEVYVTDYQVSTEVVSLTATSTAYYEVTRDIPVPTTVEITLSEPVISIQTSELPLETKLITQPATTFVTTLPLTIVAPRLVTSTVSSSLLIATEYSTRYETVTSTVPGVSRTAFVAPTPTCLSFGRASEFNAYLSGSYQGSSRVMGKLLVRGDASFSAGFCVGDQIPATGQCLNNTVVVGGRIFRWPSGRAYFGNVVTGSAESVVSSYVLDPGCELKVKKDPFDFQAATNELVYLSQVISTWFTTVSNVQITYTTLQLTLTGLNGIEVYNVNEPDYFNRVVTNVKRPSNYKPGTILVFNIFGENATMASVNQEEWADIPVVFNFPQAKTLNIFKTAVRGTILAPYADIRDATGIIWGQVFAKSMTGPITIGQSEALPCPAGVAPEPKPTTTLSGVTGADGRVTLYTTSTKYVTVSAANMERAAVTPVTVSSAERILAQAWPWMLVFLFFQLLI